MQNLIFLKMLFAKQPLKTEKKLESCPYCQNKKIIKSGKRKKKHETVQIYLCKKCQKKFTASLTKHKTYPLRVILDAITFYNRLNSLEESALQTGERYGLKISSQIISKWLSDFKEYLTFNRMREFVNKNFTSKEAIASTKMFHGQIYHYQYHRAKTNIILEETFKHYKFHPLQEFLELVYAECPHQVFKESQKRASDYKNVFNLDGVRINSRNNTAVKNTNLVLQAITNNKLRHEILQEFMLVNDSVTVAVEVPVLLDQDDIYHYRNTLNFDLGTEKTEGLTLKDEEIITGHIDLIQIRNGSIHILDYKPSAHKVKPIEQLTIYALALSRLTTLRLFHFKCAWFDEEHYYEFFPLHVVMKKRRITVARK